MIKMKKQLIVSICSSLCAFVTCCPLAIASVTRDDLKKRISKAGNDALLMQLPLTHADATADDKAIRAKIASRVDLFASTVQKLPSDSIDEALAQWIEESIVSHLSGLGLRFLSPQFGDSSYKAYVEQAALLFPKLSNERSLELLKRRDSNWTKVVKYDREFESYVTSKFSSAKVFSVNPVYPPLIKTMDEVLLARDMDRKNHPMSLVKENPTTGKELDLTDDALDSSSFTISVARLVRQEFDQDTSIQWFEYRNVISPVYIDFDKAPIFDDIRSFEESRHMIDDAFALVVHQKDDVWSFSDTSLVSFIDYSLDSAMYLKAYKPLKPNDNSMAKVAFKNDPDEWKKIEIKLH